MVFIIGLTGGIASGKSTVTNILSELGAEIIDADLVAREVVQPGQPAWQEIVKQFGEDILLSDGSIDREKLGEIVFNSPEQLEKLNKTTHPVIMVTIKDKINKFSKSKADGVLVLDAPLLIELNMTDLVDEVWLVYVDELTQLQRLQNRDFLSLKQAKSRIRAQIPLREKSSFADRIIDNSKSIENTREQILDLWEQIKRIN